MQSMLSVLARERGAKLISLRGASVPRDVTSSPEKRAEQAIRSTVMMDRQLSEREATERMQEEVETLRMKNPALAKALEDQRRDSPFEQGLLLFSFPGVLLLTYLHSEHCRPPASP